MRAGDLRALFIGPTLVYALLAPLAAPWPRGPLEILGLVASGLPLVVALSPWSLRGRYLPWAATVALAGVLLSVRRLGGTGPGSDLGLGLLLGIPLVLLALLIETRHSLAASVGLASAGLAAGALELAVVRGLPATGAATAGAWRASLVTVLNAQSVALQGASGLDLSSAPLGYLGNPVYDALGLVAVAGLLFSMLLSSERLAAADPSHAELPDTSIDFAVGQLPSTAYSLSGVVPALTTLVAIVLVVVSDSTGGPTLVGVTAAAWVVLAILIGVAFRSPAGTPAPEPPRTAA